MKATFAATVNERKVTGMAEYIEREALIEWLKRIPIIDLSDGRGLCRVIMEDDFKKAIKKMPKGIIADIAPVRRGRWLNFYGDFSTAECDICAEIYEVSPDEPCRKEFFDAFKEFYKFCPNCGAKMDLKEGERNG